MSHLTFLFLHVTQERGLRASEGGREGSRDIGPVGVKVMGMAEGGAKLVGRLGRGGCWEWSKKSVGVELAEKS